MRIKILLDNGGVIDTHPFNSESVGNFYDRVKELINLCFKIEDEKLFKEKDDANAKESGK